MHFGLLFSPATSERIMGRNRTKKSFSEDLRIGPEHRVWCLERKDALL
jgi:hypothetical protein